MKILDESHYYPFGLKHNKYSAAGFIWSPAGVIIAPIANNPFKYKFQSQELQEDHNLNWYSYRYRNYDPAIGRFFNVDPLSESFAYNGVYNFSENRVIDGFELEGLETVLINDDTGEQVGDRQISGDVMLDGGTIYNFNLGKSDPGFQSQVRGLTQTDFNFMQNAIYESKMQAYDTNTARGMYGLDGSGNIAVPQYIKDREWDESVNELYPAMKDAWTAEKTGIDPSSYSSQINPLDHIHWQMTRAKVVTSNSEALGMIGQTGVEVVASYLSGGRLSGLGQVGNIKVPVYRQFGGGISRASGDYWSMINPRLYGKNYRNFAGLPDWNTAAFQIKGEVPLKDILNYGKIRPAAPFHGNFGRLVPELKINASKVKITHYNGFPID